MTRIRIATLAFVAGSFLSVAGSVQAQTLSSDIPAEFPPASYKAKQYVDSRGCVYVRAGIDGNTTWVPRVSRDRKHICNAQPSLAKTAEAPVVATPPASAPKPVILTPAAPAVVAKKPPVVKTQKAPMKTVAAPMRVKPKPAPKRVVRVAKPKPAPKPVPAPVRTVAAAAPVASSSCVAASPVSQKYYNRSGAPGRCGPQTTPHVTVVRRSSGSDTSVKTVKDAKGKAYGQYVDAKAATGNERVLPRQVYEKRDNTVIAPPPGYRNVWNDDRLNTKRAEQTLKGHAQMSLVWTNTVPRRLINKQTGRDVTAKYPKLIYPFTDYAAQKAYLSSQGTVKAKPAKVQAIKGRYVQVGSFAVESNARNVATKLQRMGLPVKYGVSKRGGKTIRSVLAGPFGSKADLSHAMSKARNAGFHDAFIR